MKYLRGILTAFTATMLSPSFMTCCFSMYYG